MEASGYDTRTGESAVKRQPEVLRSQGSGIEQPSVEVAVGTVSLPPLLAAPFPERGETVVAAPSPAGTELDHAALAHTPSGAGSVCAQAGGRQLLCT